MSDEHDRLFAKSRALSTGFRFDEQVVKVFPDMIARSVPGYELVVPMIGMLARRYAQAGFKNLRPGLLPWGSQPGHESCGKSRAEPKSLQWIIPRPWLPAVKRTWRYKAATVPIDVRLQNILDTPIENASVVVLNFTLQFLDRDSAPGIDKPDCGGHASPAVF